MDRVQRYFFSNFIGTFASLFSTLFLIMSIIFFLRIASITSFIEINFIELLKLYLFMLPRILIFTIPIAFFVALTMALFRLSKENETIVIFTIGYETKKLTKFFIFVSVVISMIMLFVSLFMMPVAENLKDNFIDYKKTRATLNIKPNEFGQRFSDWLVFIEDESSENNRTIYKNLVMYYPSKKDEKERIILANSGEFVSENGGFAMKLYEGKAYTIDNSKWHITEFEDMIIRTATNNRIKESSKVLKYWQEMSKDKKRREEFSIYTLVSLFPLASVLFAISLGIVTYRYEKGFVYVGIFGVLFGYFALIMLLSKNPSLAIPITFLASFILSMISYRLKIAKRY